MGKTKAEKIDEVMLKAEAAHIERINARIRELATLNLLRHKWLKPEPVVAPNPCPECGQPMYQDTFRGWICAPCDRREETDDGR